MENLLVSVCLITYNHVKYIRQAIEGVLMQRVDFSFKLFIADDFSNDGTREIINSFKSKYPDSIHLIFQNENVGPATNFLDLINTPNSKYIAYLEGDDFWTDPNKLQIQINYLESNPEIFGCFHDVIVVDENSKTVKNDYYQPNKEILNQLDCVFHGGEYCTGSLMFRSSILKDLPQWFLKSPSDYALDLLITEYGGIAHIPKNMGAYRIHKGGSWQGNSMHKNLEKVIDRFFVCLTNPKFKLEYGEYFYKRISDLSSSIALHYQSEGLRFKQLKYAWFYIYYSRSKNLTSLRFLIGSLLFPSLKKTSY